MGAHASYHLIIYNLVSLKSQFQFVSDEKFKAVIKELSDYQIYPNSDNDHLPDHVQLAEKLEYKQAKMNQILRDLLKRIIDDFNDHPLRIEKSVHIIQISPFTDPEEKNTDWIKKQEEKSISVQVVLPVTPRIGDFIELPFTRNSSGFSSEDKFSYGYIHDVYHVIRGTTQEIVIQVYPRESIYYKWEKMKDEYEENKRWLAWLKTEKDRS
jgi:hypothetical protein